MHVTRREDDTVYKLVTLADGDVALVGRAIRATQEYRRWKWWRRSYWAADLANVVKYIAARNHALKSQPRE